jgi:hypothetical protein
MSINTKLKLALVLAVSLLGPAACNNQKAEHVEEEEAAAESQSDVSSTRDNREGQSSDAAFIKIFPDGDVVPTRGETATVTAPESSTSTPAGPSTMETTDPASSTSTPEGSSTTTETTVPTTAPVDNTTPSTYPDEGNTSTPSQPAPSSPTEVSAPAPDSHETQPDTADAGEDQPAAEPIAVNEPAPAPAPAPAPVEEPAIQNELEDFTRPILAVNETTASQIISVLPKEHKAIVAIGKHDDFIPGPYMLMAKWTNDSKKVKVNVTSKAAKDKNCALDETATQGEWKTLGVFYLTKKAKVVITNGKKSKYSVKNELLLKPVIADHLTSPSKFKCLGGQIKGHGLVGFQ